MEPVSLLSAREQVAEILRKAIFTGELKNNMELSQEDIASQMGTSRMPVREAFQILEREGLIDIKRRRAFVRGVTIDDIVDHLEIRAMIEGEAAARANLKCTNFDSLKLAMEKAEKAVVTNDLYKYAAMNELFHKEIWAASGSPKMENILQYLWSGLPPHLPTIMPKIIEKSILEHRKIFKAITEGTSDEARASIIEHIKRNIEDLKTHHKSIGEAE